MNDSYEAHDDPSRPPLKPRRAFRLSHLMLVLAGLAAIGAGVVLTTRHTNPTPTAPVLAPDPSTTLLADVPEPLKVGIDLPTGGVRLASESLPLEPQALAAALGEAHKKGPLPARVVPADQPGLPRQAGELADALIQKKTTQVNTFELAALAGAILKHRGLVPEYGFVPGARFAATELAARRYVVRPKGSATWLAVDGGPAPDKGVALTETEYIANLAAMRALGAMARQGTDAIDYASRAAQVARKLQPEDAAILFVAAQAESISGAPDVAARTFERAAAIASDAMTFYRLGRLARVEEQPFKAEKLFARSAETDPTFALPHIELAELTLERIDLTPKDGHPALLEKAAAALAAAEKADKNAAGLRIAKAHLLALQDNNDEARPLLMEEVKLHPLREEGWVILANVYAAEGNDAEATKTLEAALGNGIESADVYEGLGTLYASTGRFDEGKRMIERAFEKNPDDPTYRTQLAQFERHGRNFSRARELLEQQIKKFPDDTTAGLLLAQLELEQEQPGKARVQVDKVLKREPDHKEARIFRHMIAAVEGKADATARKSAIEAIGGSRQLAELFLKNGLIEEAEVILKDAIAEADEDLVVPVLLSAIYMAQNRVPEATAIREGTLAKVDAADRDELAKLFDEAIAQALQARDNPTP